MQHKLKMTSFKNTSKILDFNHTYQKNSMHPNLSTKASTKSYPRIRILKFETRLLRRVIQSIRAMN